MRTQQEGGERSPRGMGLLRRGQSGRGSEGGAPGSRGSAQGLPLSGPRFLRLQGGSWTRGGGPALGHARVCCACLHTRAALLSLILSASRGQDRTQAQRGRSLSPSHTACGGWAAEPQGWAQSGHWVSGLDSPPPSSASSVTFGPSLRPVRAPGSPGRDALCSQGRCARP